MDTVCSSYKQLRNNVSECFHSYVHIVSFFTDRDLVNAVLKGFAVICITERTLTMLFPIQIND